MTRLAGKTAVVVGAGGGIGRASAELLAQEGANVVCADVDGRAAASCADAITKVGGRATALAVDVTAAPAAELLVQAPFETFGALDVFVYSAGTTATASILDHSRADWERVIAVNLTAPFVLGQAVARRMAAEAKGGSIIFITSQLAHAAVRDKTAYLASKGGLRSLTMGMALDLAPHGIRVNAVAPGPVLTGFTERRFADPDMRRWTIGRIPAGRLGTPADIAGAVAYLASDESRWTLGTTIVVDGGYLVE
jgi:NAD(P)-dependent dehydrogenase (short-subunit alcohol dehydrogenase family)